VLLVVVLTALTLITLDTRNGRTGPLGTLGRGAHTVVSPIEGLVSDIASPIGDWWSGVTDSGDLKEENRSLKNQVAALQGQERDAQHAIDENQALRAYLRLSSLLQVKNVTATIVNRDPGNFDPTLTIDKGTESGIAVDMAVMSPAGLVGKVLESWHGGAKIQVLTDPNYAVGVVLPAHGSSPAEQGIASGQVGSNELVVTGLLPGSKVKVGDRVATSPASHIAPPDIPVGEVTRVVEEPGGTSVTAYVKPYVDIGGLQYVTVLEWVQGQPPAIPTTTTSTTTTTVPNPFGLPPASTTPTTATTTQAGG
jgi:rod shape-determining protein MreC